MVNVGIDNLRDHEDATANLEELMEWGNFDMEHYAIYFLVVTIMVAFYVTVSKILGGASSTRNEARKAAMRTKHS